jgi:hypothetical protein
MHPQLELLTMVQDLDLVIIELSDRQAARE